MRWTLWRQAGFGPPGETFTADGEVVWSWRRDPGVKLSGKARMVTVAKEAAHRGEHEISRKPLRGESRDVSAVPVKPVCVLSTIAHGAAGAVGARLSLRPLHKKRDNEMHNPGETL